MNLRILEFEMEKMRIQERDKEAVLKIFKDFKEMFDSQPVEERKELVRLLVKDVICDANKKRYG